MCVPHASEPNARNIMSDKHDAHDGTLSIREQLEIAERLVDQKGQLPALQRFMRTALPTAGTDTPLSVVMEFAHSHMDDTKIMAELLVNRVDSDLWSDSGLSPRAATVPDREMKYSEMKSVETKCREIKCSEVKRSEDTFDTTVAKESNTKKENGDLEN
ncbi:hypothetical protein AAMO2058_001294700 [Amorphochlora amoebiformis]|mmetsp:Transcript_32867/g.52881  ORF Transcript_32867/g.52881 Transcript_32867/m.52881 type:complete len:159 (-) Transcript_32867:206-682(-)